jgi:hypothetical protein
MSVQRSSAPQQESTPGRQLWIVATVVLLAACSASASGQHGGHRSGGGTEADPVIPDAGAAVNFGNSASNVPAAVNVDGGCTLGKWCPNDEVNHTRCGSEIIAGDATTVDIPGNVLMIFDRSGSMTSDWNGTARWQAAGTAMVQALMPLQDSLTIGAVFFPSDQNLLSCNVEQSTAATQLPFQAGAAALAKMQTGAANGMPMYQPGLGLTPTLEALQVADAAFASATFIGTTVAVLVTDGDPNCTWNQASAVDIVTAWASKGIKTYVVGVPGVGGNGVATLNAVAVAGGTAAYIDAADATTLQATLQKIVQQTVSVKLDSCVITFDKPAEEADMVHVTVKENGIEHEVPQTFSNGEAAWTVTPDGKVIELLGNLCLAAKAGTYERILFVFGCVEGDPPPLPPFPE